MGVTNSGFARAPGELHAEGVRSNAGADRLAHQIDHDRIAARAYEIYESHRRTDGHAEQDWLQAEAEYAVRRTNELAALER